MTIITLGGIFLVVWLLTAIFAWREHQFRIRIEAGFREVASSAALQASVMAKHAISLNEHMAVKSKIRPFVHETLDLKLESGEDASRHQKRMQVLLNFLKAYPGTSVEAAELAIESILRDKGKDNEPESKEA